MRAFSAIEISSIMGAFTGSEALRDRTLFVLGLATGFRISELLSLKVGDVRAALSTSPDAQIWIRRKNMKGKIRGRAVWVNSDARATLRLYMSTRPNARDNEPLFVSRSRSIAADLGRTGPAHSIDRRWAWRMLKQTFRRAGIFDATVATHSMRKTLAQEIFRNSGNNLYVTQKALGHASINSTVKYLESEDGDLKELFLKRRIA